MASNDKIQIMFLEKLLDNFLTENIWHTPLIITPLFGNLVENIRGHSSCWVTPKKVAKNSEVGYLRGSCELPYLVETFQFWGKATMHTEDLVVDQGWNWQVVEQVDEKLPELHVVTAFALVPETVDFWNVLAFVIATKHVNHVWVLDFVAEKETNGFDALFTSINIVAQEEISCLRRAPSVVKESQKVKELPVNICANCDRSANFEKHWLLTYNLLSSLNYLVNRW